MLVKSTALQIDTHFCWVHAKVCMGRYTQTGVRLRAVFSSRFLRTTANYTPCIGRSYVQVRLSCHVHVLFGDGLKANQGSGSALQEMGKSWGSHGNNISIVDGISYTIIYSWVYAFWLWTLELLPAQPIRRSRKDLGPWAGQKLTKGHFSWIAGKNNEFHFLNPKSGGIPPKPQSRWPELRGASIVGGDGR